MKKWMWNKLIQIIKMYIFVETLNLIYSNFILYYISIN